MSPSYTCGTARGENKSSVCSSIGKNPIANYIADFYALAAKLVVELDGAQHLEPGHQNMTHNGPEIWSSKD